MSSAESTNNTGRTLSTVERAGYSAFNAADLLIKNLIGKYLFLFYTTSLGVPPVWIAIGQPIIKLLDVVTDPLVGEWSDRTRSRHGRRRPWILFGSIALGIVFPMSWMPTFVMFWDSAPTVVSIFVYFLVFKLLYYVTHTVAVVPYYALGAELSSDYTERTRIVAWRHMIAVPIVVVATLPYMLATNPEYFPDEKTGLAVIMLAVGAIIIVTGFITFRTTTEVTRDVAEKPLPLRQALSITLSNRPFMFLTGTVFFYGLGQYFAVSFAVYLIMYIIFDGDKSQLAELLFWATLYGVIVSMLLNLLIRRLNRHIEKPRLMKICLALSLLVPLVATIAFNPRHPELYFLLHALVFPIGNTMIEILPLSIVADVCDLDELRSGRRREGAFVGVYNAAFKGGYLFAPTMTMLLLAATGFDGALVDQTQETKDLMQHYFVLGTAGAFGLALLLGAGVRLTKAEVLAAQGELAEG